MSTLRERINAVENEELRIALHNVVSYAETSESTPKGIEKYLRKSIKVETASNLTGGELLELSKIVDRIFTVYDIDK